MIALPPVCLRLTSDSATQGKLSMNMERTWGLIVHVLDEWGQWDKQTAGRGDRPKTQRDKVNQLTVVRLTPGDAHQTDQCKSGVSIVLIQEVLVAPLHNPKPSYKTDSCAVLLFFFLCWKTFKSTLLLPSAYLTLSRCGRRRRSKAAERLQQSCGAPQTDLLCTRPTMNFPLWDLRKRKSRSVMVRQRCVWMRKEYWWRLIELMMAPLTVIEDFSGCSCAADLWQEYLLCSTVLLVGSSHWHPFKWFKAFLLMSLSLLDSMKYVWSVGLYISWVCVPLFYYSMHVL